jgi:hypothetical protein
MEFIRNQASLTALVSQTFLYFKCLLEREHWSERDHEECCELICQASDLRKELASFVGIEEAYRIVKEEHEKVFPERYTFRRRRS